MFDHEEPAVISAMRNLNVGVFEHIKITSPVDLYNILAHMQPILRGAALKKYREVLVTYRQWTKELTGDGLNLGKLAWLSAEAFWTWDKIDTTGYDGNPFLAQDKCVD